VNEVRTKTTVTATTATTAASSSGGDPIARPDTVNRRLSAAKREVVAYLAAEDLAVAV